MFLFRARNVTNMSHVLQVNLSPALSNDCEVDSEVKKPLLHDLFDLLGLPVCNTGLSLFTIWSSDHRIEDEDEVSSKFGRSTKKKSRLGREADAFLNLSPETRATVIAEKCSRFVIVFINCTLSADRVKSRAFRVIFYDLLSQLRQSTPEVCPTAWSRYNPLLMDKCIRRGFKGSTIEDRAPPPIWDNGRDWRTPCVKEGGWIRVCPFTRAKHVKSTEYARPSPRTIDNEIKNMVFCIRK